MPEEKIIMFDSPEAASVQTVTGWMSSDGRFWADNEDMARYCGSTHRKCEKDPDHPIYRTNSYCQVCRDVNRAARFDTLPRKAWGGEPLVIFDGDRYFFDEDDLRDFIIEGDVDLADLKLCICNPNMPHEIDPSDHFCDDLPEDGEIQDDQLLAAFELVNEIIRKSGPLSWSQGEYVVILPQAFLDSVEAERRVVTP